MFAVLAVLFVVMPFVELYVIVQVSHVFGVVTTLGILFLVSVVGAWLVKKQGIEVFRRAQARVDEGRLPGRELVDGVLILFAGVLLLTPGFVTDAVGILLLLPPVRAGVRFAALRYLSKRVVEL